MAVTVLNMRQRSKRRRVSVVAYRPPDNMLQWTVTAGGAANAARAGASETRPQFRRSRVLRPMTSSYRQTQLSHFTHAKERGDRFLKTESYIIGLSSLTKLKFRWLI